MTRQSHKKFARPHRPREEKELRQFIGATVRAASKDRLHKWISEGKSRRRVYNLGRAIDELVDFAEKQKFEPAA